MGTQHTKLLDVKAVVVLVRDEDADMMYNHPFNIDSVPSTSFRSRMILLRTKATRCL